MLQDATPGDLQGSKIIQASFVSDCVEEYDRYLDSSSFGQKTPRRKILRGAGTKRPKREPIQKVPKTKLFSGLKWNQTRVSLHPSSIQTITVGSGVPPDHVLRLRSALVGCTTDRELHPAPKVLFDCQNYTLPSKNCIIPWPWHRP